ncbi:MULTISPECIES: hypothetical protein [Halomicrobium]|uniref:Uncharacterized protein n=1 Tax=Halomicrobium mukohataei TaxID=57705 RepID=A0A4D6KMI9_9EURY|nr:MULTISPECIES: hypothetical protein [Halomicrobium]QCD66733.1 hypothetical protein E5139_14155 [Halomicrobium mukohataei]QFR21539.1 hypothetical protein GBQ70_14170 [Halomicrobium sp. ZPS1]
MLAVLTVILAAVWVAEPGFMFDDGIVAVIANPIFIPATLLVPGLLAVSVLARVGRHGVRLASSYVGSDNRTQPDDTSLPRIGASLVLGGLAGYTLWWVIGSVYVITIADASGVMLAPLVALVAGSVLGFLLLARSLLDLVRFSVGDVR